MCLQRKFLKIMCDVEKQCYMNIVFVRCIVKCIDCDFIHFVSQQKKVARIKVQNDLLFQRFQHIMPFMCYVPFSWKLYNPPLPH